MNAGTLQSPVAAAIRPRQSIYGVASCALGIASLCTLAGTIVLVGAFGLARAQAQGIEPNSPAFGRALGLFSLFLSFVGLVLGVVGTLERDRRNASAWVGSVTNAIVFSVTLMLVIEYVFRPSLQ